VALPFIVGDDEHCGQRTDRMLQSDRGRHARRGLSRKPGHIGAVAFNRTEDLGTGDVGDAKIIKKFGKVPDDLSAL
jgi:hypothetical protein